MVSIVFKFLAGPCGFSRRLAGIPRVRQIPGAGLPGLPVPANCRRGLQAFQVSRIRALSDRAPAGDLAMAQSQFVAESQCFFNLSHGQPFRRQCGPMLQNNKTHCNYNFSPLAEPYPRVSAVSQDVLGSARSRHQRWRSVHRRYCRLPIPACCGMGSSMGLPGESGVALLPVGVQNGRVAPNRREGDFSFRIPGSDGTMGSGHWLIGLSGDRTIKNLSAPQMSWHLFFPSRFHWRPTVPGRSSQD